MTIKNIKLTRVAGMAATVVILWLSLAGMAQAHTIQNSSAMTESQHAIPVMPARNGASTGCVFQTVNGHYLTAVSGGGRITDVLHTDATRIGSWEKFNLWYQGYGSAYAIQTLTTNYLTAVDGGGRITDVIHSDAVRVQSWERFSLISLEDGVYAIQTINGHYLTAVGGGGRITDTIHSDATWIRAWERFRVSCGH